MDNIVSIIKIGTTYHLKGELKLTLLSTDSEEKILHYKTWYIKNTFSNWIMLKNFNIFRRQDNFFCHIPCFDTKEKASKLTNCLVGVLRTDFLPISKDEFYLADLVGMLVLNEKGESFGTVVNMLNTLAHDVMVSELCDKEFLIPFTYFHIKKVNFIKRTILVNWYYDY